MSPALILRQHMDRGCLHTRNNIGPNSKSEFGA